MVHMTDQSGTATASQGQLDDGEDKSEIQQAFEAVEDARLRLSTISEEQLPRVDVDAEWSDEDLKQLKSSIESVRKSIDTTELDLVSPEQTLDELVDEEGELPFSCEWEVGINEAGDPDNWDHYHPIAKSEKEAKRKAQQEAREDGYTDPYPIHVYGPVKPKNTIRVGEEMISQFFGSD